MFQQFSDTLAVVLEFLTLYDKQNIRTFSVNIKLIRTRMFHARKARQSLADLPVSKARTNILYIFLLCKYLVYVFLMQFRLIKIAVVKLVLMLM